jgi:hypothetical protein
MYMYIRELKDYSYVCMYMYIRELYTQRSKRPLGWEQDAEVSPNTLVVLVAYARIH